MKNACSVAAAATTTLRMLSTKPLWQMYDKIKRQSAPHIEICIKNKWKWKMRRDGFVELRMRNNLNVNVDPYFFCLFTTICAGTFAMVFLPLTEIFN